MTFKRLTEPGEPGGGLGLQITDFWHQLEIAANEQQRTVIGKINKQLDKLSLAIERSVGEVLDVRLEPVHLHIKAPSSEEFHECLAVLFKRGGSTDLRVKCPLTCA